MALPEFIDGVRIAAGFLSPEVWTDSPDQSADEMARSLQLADIWLTPAVVRDFAEADFVWLPDDQRNELRQAVEKFRAVAEKVDPKAPADQSQVDEALPALLTILRIMRPYIADQEALDVRRAVWRACYGYRNWIPSFDFKLGEDSTGQPAVWVWFILNNDVDVRTREVMLRLFEVRDTIRKYLVEDGINRNLYTSAWSRSEVVPWVLGGAAA
jgi:hypothetical protein